MKHLVILSLTALACLSCNDDKNDFGNINPLGTYALVEVLADPGDGSGTFQPATTKEEIQLRSDGILLANGQLCAYDKVNIITDALTISSASDTIIQTNCDDKIFRLSQDELIVSFMCIEPCASKYKKQ